MMFISASTAYYDFVKRIFIVYSIISYGTKKQIVSCSAIYYLNSTVELPDKTKPSVTYVLYNLNTLIMMLNNNNSSSNNNNNYNNNYYYFAMH